jgi:hypothetical protein
VDLSKGGQKGSQACIAYFYGTGKQFAYKDLEKS